MRWAECVEVNVGTAAAIANAVYHATGKRIRQLPLRFENLLTA
jgi:xanthine dehydrogenase YagR molybdenum-binding subunit